MVLDYLIPDLRTHLGDTTSVYSTDLLSSLLLAAFKALIPRWRYKYLIDASDTISRNPNVYATEFIIDSPPIIQKFDERPIILEASIILKGGNLQSNGKNIQYGSWRDDELSLSTIASKEVLTTSLQSDINELDSLLPPRTNKLARPRKQSLLGFNTTQGNYSEDS